MWGRQFTGEAVLKFYRRTICRHGPTKWVKKNKKKQQKNKDFKCISRIDYTKPAWKTKGQISEVA